MIGIIVLVLVVITIYLIFYVIYPPAGNKDLLPDMAPLNAKKDVGLPDVVQTTLLGSNGCTVMGYFLLKDGDRTAKMSQPYLPLIQIANNWYLEISPAPAGKERTSARLRIQTNHGGTFGSELVDLPPIPKQKWIFLAILREGRRFDILYDNRIVASHRLEHYPVVITSPLSVGSPGLNGSVIHVMINGKRLSPNEVERERVAHVDTNNMVMEANKINMSLPKIEWLASCPSGLPCNPVTKPPKNNLVEWNSPYA
jgi:hypothetical protein